jgi:uncharacterized protein YjbI with pentapeptide repeats
MDRDAFDGLTKLLAAAPTRRATLGALLGAALTGTLGAEAAKKARGRRRRDGGSVTAAATCASPGPSANLSGCDFAGMDFSGQDLSGSRMVGTVFRNATLVGTDLSSSNLKDATFRGADLTCANLRASTLRNADFRGPSGMALTDLTGADLSSSGCGGIRFDGKTRFCRTRLCNGAFRDEDCPGGVAPEGFCCTDADCPSPQACIDHRCGGCRPAACEAQNNACRTCSCAGDSCLCAFRACVGGPCDPVTGCPPTCEPVSCEALSNACQSCGCSAGLCACAQRACENGPCDPQTGCP